METDSSEKEEEEHKSLRERIDNIYQEAVLCGMSKKQFYHSTIRDVNIFLYAYQKRERENIKMMEYNAWLNGIYVMNAVSSCFDKKHEYPENPLARKDIKSLAEKTGKTEVEMNRELVMATLKIKQANAELNEKLGTKKTDSESDE